MQSLLLIYDEGKLSNNLIKICEIYGATMSQSVLQSGFSEVLIASLKIFVALTHNYGNESRYFNRNTSKLNIYIKTQMKRM